MTHTLQTPGEYMDRIDDLRDAMIEALRQEPALTDEELRRIPARHCSAAQKATALREARYWFAKERKKAS